MGLGLHEPVGGTLVKSWLGFREDGEGLGMSP